MELKGKIRSYLLMLFVATAISSCTNREDLYAYIRSLGTYDAIVAKIGEPVATFKPGEPVRYRHNRPKKAPAVTHIAYAFKKSKPLKEAVWSKDFTLFIYFHENGEIEYVRVEALEDNWPTNALN